MSVEVSDEMVLLVVAPRPHSQGKPWIDAYRDGIADLLAEPEIRAAIQSARCQACPLGCPSCTHDQSDCECYEHQGVPAVNDLKEAFVSAAVRATDDTVDSWNSMIDAWNALPREAQTELRGPR